MKQDIKKIDLAKPDGLAITINNVFFAVTIAICAFAFCARAPDVVAMVIQKPFPAILVGLLIYTIISSYFFRPPASAKHVVCFLLPVIWLLSITD